MAFALTRFEARSIDIASPSYRRGIQEIVMDVTGDAADVDLDIGDESGTFWTDALADAVYGELAAKALLIMQKLSNISASFVGHTSAELVDRVQVAALTGAGQYTLALDSLGPNIAFDAADGETAYHLILRYELPVSQFPIIALYGQSYA